MASIDVKEQARIGKLLSLSGGHVHMLGICGVGMAGLAFLLKERGFRVTGCDSSPGRLAQWLEARDINVFHGHSARHVEDAQWVVRTSAVAPDSVEVQRALEFNVPVFRRGMVLAELLRTEFSIAVSGTHGKTTTTAFIAQLCGKAGRPCAWCIGGEVDSLGGVAGIANAGGSGEAEQDLTIVAEADESDGTLACYSPDIAVINNIEFDHMEHFESVEAFEECFLAMARQAGTVVYSADDPRASALLRSDRFRAGLRRTVKLVSFGLSPGADIRGVELDIRPESLSFMAENRGETIGRLELPVTGRHNVMNALAATAVALELGLDAELIRDVFCGIDLPRRRFERIVQGEIAVVSDYAHHPTEISAAVRSAMRQKYTRLLGVFQPHRYSRTLALGRDFPAAFRGLDELVLAPVYAASEKPLKGGTSSDLYARIREAGVAGGSERASKPWCRLGMSLEQVRSYLDATLRAGDLFLVIGAGDVEKLAEWARTRYGPGASRSGFDARSAAEALKPSLRATQIRHDEPLAGKTTLGVGGTADTWMEIGCVEDLRTVMRWCGENSAPFQILGAGSNVLVSDLGVRGITARLGGGEFDAIRTEIGGMTAGAAVPLSRLLSRMEAEGLSGLEFAEGIPGSVGGAVRMNAGAFGGSVVERTGWIRCLKSDGTERIIRGEELKFQYRRCISLDDSVLIEAFFCVDQASPEAVKERRGQIAGRREWMKGMRSAGSVFRNPPGDHAGRLIDSLGLKGLSVGGARVSDRHANVICAGEGATASDVRALIEAVRNEVLQRLDIELEPEIVMFGE